MDEVVAVGLSPAVLDQVLASRVPRRMLLRDALSTLAEELAAGGALVLASSGDGVAVAQAARRADPDVSVVLVAEDAAVAAQLRTDLTVTPGIGRHTLVVVAGDEGAPALVAEELGWACRRREHRQTMAAVRSALGQLVVAPPETLSRYLRQLFDHAPIGILLTDAEGVIRAANAASAAVLGGQPRHALGLDLSHVFAGPAALAAKELLDQSALGAETEPATLERTGPAGSCQWVQMRVAPVDPGQPTLGAIVLLTDETDRLTALAQADEARRAAEGAAARYAALASTLRESLLPPRLPEVPGIEAAAYYHPAGDGSEVGGDFYDLFEAGDGTWTAVMGDVCGKGAGAARLTALARYTLWASTVRSARPDANLADLDRALARHAAARPDDAGRFATVAVVRLAAGPDGVEVQAATGGHPPPVVVRVTGSVEEVACAGPLLGVLQRASFTTGRTLLAPGDLLVLVTDGVTEARNGVRLFGDDGLRHALTRCAGLAAEEVVTVLEQALSDFDRDHAARDDTAILVLRAH